MLYSSSKPGSLVETFASEKKMKRLPRPCLDCGVLTSNPSRCDRHQAEADQRRAYRQENNLARKIKKARLYSSKYQAQARALRATATTCYLCLKQRTETDPLEADHLYPSLYDQSPLLAAHRSCNNSKGNRAVNELDSSEWPGVEQALKMFPPSVWLRDANGRPLS